MDISTIKYKSVKELPKFEIVEPNLCEANILQKDFAGVDGELTAVMTYIYQSLIIQPFDDELAKLFKNIAIVEMEHFYVLGEMIVALGGNPVYANYGRYWSGKIVNYNQNLKEMLVNNIKGEKIAIEGYKCSIEKIKNPSINNVLNAIIEDEKVHIEAFKTILEYITFWK